jgi:hypothetical protein
MVPVHILCLAFFVSAFWLVPTAEALPALLPTGAWKPAAESMTVVSGPALPRVAYALNRNRGELMLLFEVAPFSVGLPDPRVEVGIAAAKKVTGRAGKAGGRWQFRVPVANLVEKEEDWQHLRLAFAVSWPDSSGTTDLQRERFFCLDSRAPHAGLPADSALWRPFPLDEYQRELAERNKQIRLAFRQPLNGKATLVIEDQAGRRVRNLISGQPFATGDQQVTWDGLDEDGRLVAPGDYRWRGAVHAGITPQYLFSFYNHGRPPFRNGTGGSNWGADHSNPVAAAVWGDRVYIGSPVAESGHNIIQLTLDGVKTAHAHIPAHVGQGRLFLVADESGFYALTEGKSWYVEPRDLGGDKWEADRPASLLHWDLEGRELRYSGPRGEAVLAANTYAGTGKADRKTRIPAADNLAGAALLHGAIFAAFRQDNRILKVDPASGKTIGTFAVAEPGLLATDGQALFAFAGAQLARIDLDSGNAAPLFTPALSGTPTGLAIGADGEFFIADNGPDQNVKVFAGNGTLKRQIGVKGGRQTLGAWNGETGVYQPHGIALDRNARLWVAENDTWPRRISAWNAADGTLWRDFFGPTFYGAPGGSFDPVEPNRWIGANVLWKLDFARQNATPLATLYRQTRPGQMEIAMPATSFNFVRRDGRTFLVGQSKYESVYELKADGTAKLWAMCGNLGASSQ